MNNIQIIKQQYLNQSKNKCVCAHTHIQSISLQSSYNI